MLALSCSLLRVVSIHPRHSQTHPAQSWHPRRSGWSRLNVSWSWSRSLFTQISGARKVPAPPCCNLEGLEWFVGKWDQIWAISLTTIMEIQVPFSWCQNPRLYSDLFPLPAKVWKKMEKVWHSHEAMTLWQVHLDLGTTKRPTRAFVADGPRINPPKAPWPLHPWIHGEWEAYHIGGSLSKPCVHSAATGLSLKVHQDCGWSAHRSQVQSAACLF